MFVGETLTRTGISIIRDTGPITLFSAPQSTVPLHRQGFWALPLPDYQARPEKDVLHFSLLLVAPIDKTPKWLYLRMHIATMRADNFDVHIVRNHSAD